MNKKMIEGYIEFAIENGYSFGLEMKYKEYQEVFTNAVVIEDITDGDEFNLNLIQLITSEEFIQAIAAGLESMDDKIPLDSIAWECSWIDKLTYHQAIAIRDNTLEQFIEELLTK